MASLKEIAESADVCVETVSRVLKGKYKGRTSRSRAIMRRVRREAERVNYRPNNAARAMRTNSTGLIGVVIDENSLMTHPVVTETIKGINEELDACGYTLTITSLDGISESTLESRIFREHLLDGIIIIDNIETGKAKLMRSLIPACIMVNMNYWGAYCCVRRDEYHSGFTAGTELALLGYRNALYFDLLPDDRPDGESHYSFVDRLAGFQESFGRKNTHVVRINPADFHGYLVENIGEINAGTVIVPANILRLFRLSSVFSRLPIAVGRDCGLASLDDETGLLASFPEVSRMTFPRIEIGRRAGRMMVSLLKGRKPECRSLQIKGEWICGQTTPKAG